MRSWASFSFPGGKGPSPGRSGRRSSRHARGRAGSSRSSTARAACCSAFGTGPAPRRPAPGRGGSMPRSAAGPANFAAIARRPGPGPGPPSGPSPGPGRGRRPDQVVDQEVHDLPGLGGAAVGLLAAGFGRSAPVEPSRPRRPLRLEPLSGPAPRPGSPGPPARCSPPCRPPGPGATSAAGRQGRPVPPGELRAAGTAPTAGTPRPARRSGSAVTSAAKSLAVSYRRSRSFSSAFITIQSSSPRTARSEPPRVGLALGRDGRERLAQRAQPRARPRRLLLADDPPHLVERRLAGASRGRTASCRSAARTAARPAQ